MLEAGLNCLPASLLFLGLASLAYGLMPRASTGIAYGLVSVAFVWQLFGSLIGAPQWIVDLSPFQHVGLVPAQPFHVTAAIVMVVARRRWCAREHVGVQTARPDSRLALTPAPREGCSIEAAAAEIGDLRTSLPR